MRLIKNLSLKIKLLLLLISLTSGMLALYGYMAVSSFEKDKTAYVLDANLGHARAIRSQMQTEIDLIIGRIRYFMRGYDFAARQFSPDLKRRFPDDELVMRLTVLQEDEATHKFLVAAELSKAATDAQASDSWWKGDSKSQSVFSQKVMAFDMALHFDTQDIDQWWLGLRFNERSSSRSVLVVAQMRQPSFLAPFSKNSAHDTYLMDSTGRVVIRPMVGSYPKSQEQLQAALSFANTKAGFDSGVFRIEDSARRGWLIAFARPSLGGLTILDLVPESFALQGLKALVVKSVLFLLFLLFLTIFVSVIAAFGLTSKLNQLVLATRRISQGDFDIDLGRTSRDEMGVLANSFQLMAGEIRRLILETAEKARMEGELKTAQVVQATLFPQVAYESSVAEIRGFYKPASECSGDWWHYSSVGQRLYFWIGDATGHGVPAALVTSAAKSAAGVLERLVESYPNTPLNEVMSLFNQAIYGTSRGQVMMTFFLGCFDGATGRLEYCNASHDPPLLLSKRSGYPIKRQHLIPLADGMGPRVGESADSTYQVYSEQLTPGDRVVFYTDGVTEMLGPEQAMWGERPFVHFLIKAFNEGQDLTNTLTKLNEQLEGFRQGVPLRDDVTYFMFQYLEQPALAQAS